MSSAIGHTAYSMLVKEDVPRLVIESMKYLSAEELDRALGCAASEVTNLPITLLESPYISVDNMAWGATPLFCAAHNENPAMIQALLKRGANPSRHVALRKASVIRPSP